MLVGAAQIAIAAPLHAQERQVDFDIPAQELSKSLREFAATTDMDKAVYLDGPAGSVTIHNCRTLHYSKANYSDTPRPLLLNVYAAADAFPYTHNPLNSKYDQAIVRGKRARYAHHDPRPCLIPPDWSGGYTSIYAAQAGEDEAAA